MSRVIQRTVLVALLITVVGLNAADSVEPIQRTDQNSRIAHEQLLAKAKQGRIDVYFVGDSITRRWGATDPQHAALLQNWKSNFFGWNAANFGWGGDTTRNILWRLQNGELDGVNPKIIVVSAGINDIGKNPSPERASEVSAGIKAILDVCREKAPSATIVLTAIFPRNDSTNAAPVVTDVNRQIATFADGKAIRFIDINRKIADENGIYFEGFVNSDKLHPSIKTYQAWADALKPIFREILGPPAARDEAPPATGDPSVKAAEIKAK